MNYTKLSKELAQLKSKANELKEKQEDKILSLLYECYKKNTNEEFEILMFRGKQFILGYGYGDGNEHIYICKLAYRNFGLSNNQDEFVADLCGCNYIKEGTEDYLRVKIISKLMENNFLEKGLVLMREYRKEIKPFIDKIYDLENQLKEWERKTETKR